MFSSTSNWYGMTGVLFMLIIIGGGLVADLCEPYLVHFWGRVVDWFFAHHRRHP
jgi:hypothetical protein